MEHTIKLSVVIPSYNGANKVFNALDCLKEQTFKDFEVIVVVDGSTDNSVTLLKNYSSSYSLFFIDQPNQGRSTSRNNGVQKAQSELLVFLDDDMLPEKDFLRKHYEFHQLHSNSVLVGCAFRDPDGAKTAFDQYLIQIENGWKIGFEDSFKVSIERFAFTGANFSISKSNFYKVGKFKGVLPDTEDFDFGVRTLISNIDVYYNINVKAWHNDFCGLERFIRRLQEYKVSNRKLFDLNPQYKLLFPKHTIVAPKRPVKLFILYIILKLKLHRFWIDSAVFNLLPLKVKFWFYKLLISAHLNHI